MQDNWRNSTGKPLSSYEWLGAHHKAKLPERKKITKDILSLNPKTIVDLGCGFGLWLDLFDEFAIPECKLVGIDNDPETLSFTKAKASQWKREADFFCCNIENEIEKIPCSDMFLMFNMFSYIKDPIRFLELLRNRLNPGGVVIIRQYDGSVFNFGPMDADVRLQITNSLHAAVSENPHFIHYNIDRVYEAVMKSNYINKETRFELFQRHYPFTDQFQQYLSNEVEWMLTYISDAAGKKLKEWKENYLLNIANNEKYFFETELIGMLYK